MENCPNMGKERVTQEQEEQRVPYRINPRRNTPRHMLIKLTKIKFTNLKEENIQVQEAQRVLNKMNQDRSTPMNIHRESLPIVTQANEFAA